MATVLSDAESAEIRKQSDLEEELKRKEQEAEGKEFVNHGQGVIPEEKWQNLPGKTEQPEE